MPQSVRYCRDISKCWLSRTARCGCSRRTSHAYIRVYLHMCVYTRDNILSPIVANVDSTAASPVAGGRCVGGACICRSSQIRTPARAVYRRSRNSARVTCLPARPHLANLLTLTGTRTPSVLAYDIVSIYLRCTPPRPWTWIFTDECCGQKQTARDRMLTQETPWQAWSEEKEGALGYRMYV